MFIKKHPDVDGIFCSSDIIAIYVISVLNKLDYNVPNDVQVIGFDNIQLASVLNPPLTTIAQPISEIGVAAVSRLIQMISKKPIDDLHHVLPVYLIERNSTK